MHVIGLLSPWEIPFAERSASILVCVFSAFAVRLRPWLSTAYLVICLAFLVVVVCLALRLVILSFLPLLAIIYFPLIFCSNVFSMLISRAACLASEKHSDLPSQENETNISNVAILAPSSVPRRPPRSPPLLFRSASYGSFHVVFDEGFFLFSSFLPRVFRLRVASTRRRLCRSRTTQFLVFLYRAAIVSNE